jgi:uncharacterized membrane protein
MFPALAVWVLIALVSLSVVAATIGAPFAQSNGYPTVATWIYETFSYVCHQIPERSFHVANHKFAACSRCTGLYSGLAFAALVYPFARSLRRTETPRIFWLILAAAPLAIDFGLGYFSIWENTQLSRFATGALLGAVAMFYILPGLIDLSIRVAQFIRRKTQMRPHSRSGF